MSVEIRRSSERFVTKGERRQTRHSLSFGEHYDPDQLRFGPMVCHDDHWLGGGAGFDEHPHGDLEIVSWVLSGAVEHTDSTGSDATARPGTVQVLSAGSGVRHTERAATGVGPTRFVQAWLVPDETGTEPAYAVAPVDLTPDTLVPVASGDGGAALRIRTAGATLWVARLSAGATVTVPDAPRQHVFVATGALSRSSLAEPLAAGDAFRVTDTPGVSVTAAVPTELMVWTFAA